MLAERAPVVEALLVCTGDHTENTLAQVAREHLLDNDAAAQMAEIFKALADPTRVRIIGLLAHMEICVGDLHQMLGMSQPAVSHHLRILRGLRLVKARKDGRHVFYTLDDEHVALLYRQGLNHVLHD